MPRSSAQKRATNVTLNAELIDEAKRLRVNISEACERGLSEQVAKSRAETWREENREAILASNAWVEKHGLPLARYRSF